MSLLVDIEKDYGGFHLCSRFETNGGITGLLGASGCGKSQTLRCIAGVQTPDQGRIVLDGVTLYDSEQHINLTPQQRGVGYLFQSYALFPNMTVRANILTGLRREKDAAKKQAAFEHAIHLLKLEGLEDRRPAQLSGGQAQRVALARMLVSRPKALLLDEPFSAIDSHLRDQLQVDPAGPAGGFPRRYGHRDPQPGRSLPHVRADRRDGRRAGAGPRPHQAGVCRPPHRAGWPPDGLQEHLPGPQDG